MVKFVIADAGYSIAATEYGWIYFFKSPGTFVSEFEEAHFFDSIEEAQQQLDLFKDSGNFSIIKVNWHEA
jgi:hypothetical protein